MRLLFKILFLGLFMFSAQAQNSNPLIAFSTPKPVLNDFMLQRFGMFIHWGPVTLRGTEIGWSRGSQVPVIDYDNLYKEFNPVLFNAEEWVKIAKDAGMKYLTITAKHHDGFCLWPSKYTDYTIANTPFKRDVVGELAKACKKQGIKFCIYYSVLDWHYPDYPIHLPGGKPDPKADINKYVTYMKNQLSELIKTYHPYMLWFDGNWEKEWTESIAVDMYAHIKKEDPNVIVNNRLGSTLNASGAHKVLDAKTVGDFATPEQKIGEINMDIPWESCITICKQWAWKPNDSLKTLKTCIQTLAKTAGGNGNLLFNVGPMLDGRIEARQLTRLNEMGAWLNKYGESIYGTIGGPWVPNEKFASTRKGNKIYIHVFDGSLKKVVLPPILTGKIKSANLLVDGSKVHVITEEPVEGGTANLFLQLPAQMPDENDTVIVLELNIDAEQLPIIR